MRYRSDDSVAVTRLPACLTQVLVSRTERLVGHPDHHCVEVPIDARQVLGPHEHVAAAHVNLVAERQGHGHRRERLGPLALPGHHSANAAAGSGRQRHDLVAGPDDAGGNRSCKPAEIQVRSVDVLDGETEIDQVPIRRHVDRVEAVQQRLAPIPIHVSARIDDVVAVQRRYRDETQIREFELGGELGIRLPDGFEDSLRIAPSDPSCSWRRPHAGCRAATR